ncbi:MAG: hypothetical protein V2I47_10125 [Bacteroidales bacterium]|jgi:hypothetical protein|nr:hypothetical protein [Bacteroidales bacterium]
MRRNISGHIIIMLVFIMACSNENKQPETENIPPARASEVSFLSSDPQLNAAWRWAKEKALSYVRTGDPVGPWYEASLPGREAFCMRDVSHMCTGAAVLGLQEENKTMLYRFAENISESKDWCSYWEITRDNGPAPVDYRYEKDFWYNLPANFDVLDACFRMYLWTGDSVYVNGPVFTSFYHATMNEYIDRWDLSADRIMQRERIMNLPEGASPDNHKFYYSRGIPGYFEGAGGEMQLGIDLLATQYAANSWYHYYMSNAEGGSKWLDEAANLKSIITEEFWDEKAGRFNIVLYRDGTMEKEVGNGADFSYSLLHYNVLNDPEMISSVLDTYSENKDTYIIEIASHLPDIFFRNERINDGIYMLKYLTDSTTKRREYPENPFAVVGAFVTGLMGITPGAPDNFISTYSRMPDPSSQLMVSNLPVIGKKIDLLHRGRHTSMVHNHSDEAFFWKPYLAGDKESWYINGKEEKGFGKHFKFKGMDVTSFLIKVEPHTRASVSAYPPPSN